jgi:basic membrane lipoprotein Med (substrate-binding protein (PBP1-ABC) superfamily)
MRSAIAWFAQCDAAHSNLDQGHYVNGVAVGLSTKSHKIGFVAAKPIALVLRNVNSFLIGVKKVNPAAEVSLIITGEWSLPVREAESTNALIDAGCDVIACHVDSPKVVIERAEARGVKTCGHNADQSPLAPKGFITGAELKHRHPASAVATAFVHRTDEPGPTPTKVASRPQWGAARIIETPG